MSSLVLKNFFRSKATIIGLAFILLAGTTSLVIGKHFLQQKQEAIELIARHQQQHITKHVHYFHSDIGLLLYNLQFSLVNAPGPLTGISIGQRDVHPSIQSVNIRNLENQKYDTDLTNPSNLLLGNLDLGFVIIYLFPLLIIAFTYNILSEEKEGGTWNMIWLHAASPIRVLWQKLMIRIGVVYAAAILLMVLAITYLSIPLDSALLAVSTLFTLYLLFWGSLSYWVVSWGKSSNFNAVCMLAFWIFLTILTPALVNSYISNAYPVPEAIQTAVKQRQGYHEKWDMDKQSTVNKFFQHYPQLVKYDLPDKEFSWLWYYAMQQMGDDEVRQESSELNEKLWKRDEVSSRIALFLPVLHTQLALNDIAGSGLKNHLRFLDSTTRFHEQMRLFFYPAIFENNPVSSIDWRNINVQHFCERQVINWFLLLAPLLLMSGGLFLLGHYCFVKQ
jgi:ABC-2 type transport system permease protein